MAMAGGSGSSDHAMSAKRAREEPAAPAAGKRAGEYPMVLRPGPRGEGLPGLTRSVYERDHALITPESRVWCGLPGWAAGKHSAAYLASPQMPGAIFSMCLVRMDARCTAGKCLPGVERFIFLIEGEVEGFYKDAFGDVPNMLQPFKLEAGKKEYAYFPAGTTHTTHGFSTETGAVVLMFEQVYRPHPVVAPSAGTNTNGPVPRVFIGNVDEQPMIDPGAPEVFGLRKLLPLSVEYDFNIHIMDFEPGQFLHCNEMHYNQHGMLMLEGQGIYRLGETKWYHVRAGDAIYMAPYVPQWYAALEPGRTRYILYKDTYRDPLQSGSAGIVHPSAPCAASK